MHSYQVRTDYDVLYDAAWVQARNWSAARLTITLDIALSKASQNEARWGVIDALTDLLGLIKPPGSRWDMQ